MEINIGNENVEKQRQLDIMEEDEDGMSVPNWLVDVLKWIARIEMANSSLSFSCKLFKQLCWPKLHGDVKAYSVKFLEYCGENDEFGNIRGTYKNRHQQIIPLALTSPPEYIHGFETITIRLLDTKIIEFVQNIAIEEVNLLLYNWKKNDEQFTLMRNLLMILANNISELQISNHLDSDLFLDFNQQFPNFIDQVHHLDVAYLCDLDLDIIFNWLMKPLINGKQKILCCDITRPAEQQREMELRFLNRIKEEFLHSTEKKNFLVQLEHEYEQFSMENEQTGEVLNLYQEMSSYGDFMKNFLARYPKGEEHWKEGSEEKIWGNGKTLIRLEIDNDE